MKFAIFLFSGLFCSGMILGANPNYDESKVPSYSLPNVLSMPGGKSEVESFGEWESKVKPALLSEFEKIYSPIPPVPEMTYEVVETFSGAFGELATRSQIKATAKTDLGEFSFHFLIYIPKNASKEEPVPAILGYNFCGNHTICDDPAIILPDKWIPKRGGGKLISKDNKSSQSQRGKMAFRWNVQEILKRGYAFAALYYGDIYPDHKDGLKDSAYRIFPKKGGAISAWAWGGSRVMDYLCTLPEIDKDRIAVIGHSRLGKTALITGVFDGRFALACSNDSGCMGAALSRRKFGETIRDITKNFPYWFAGDFDKCADKEDEMPVDQHQLLACMAPRAVYVASAEDDKWADPKGEFLSLKEASKVYKLAGAKRLPLDSDFRVEKQFIGDNIGYHMRKGPHNLLSEDWEFYFKFFDAVLKGKNPPKSALKASVR